MDLLSGVAWFFAGGFLANTIPHLVNGVSGNRFPTPFAKPPGRGLSSPLVNVVWAFGNLAAFGVIVWLNPGSFSLMNAVLAFLGMFALSLVSSTQFAHKDEDKA